MNLHALQSFIAVAMCKSFTKAAVEQNLSQSTISKRIANLESDLSSSLFDRLGHAVELTEAGEVLLPSANWISAELHAVKGTIIDKDNVVQGTLRIGVSGYVELNRITSVIETYRNFYPKVEIEIEFGTEKEVLSKISQGTINIGLCSAAESNACSKNIEHNGDFDEDSESEYLFSKEIWAQEIRAVVHKQHDLAAVKNVSLNQLSRYPAILPNNHTQLRKVIDKEMGRSTNVLTGVETSDMLQVQTLVKCGIGWSFLPMSEIDSSSMVLLTIDDLPLVHYVNIVSYTNRTMSRATKEFVDLMDALPYNAAPVGELSLDASNLCSA